MLKFVTTNAESLGKKRKQSQRACEQCRKRKKRCDHLPEEQLARLNGDSPTQEASLTPISAQTTRSNQSRSNYTSRQADAQHPQSIVFVGDGHQDRSENWPMIQTEAAQAADSENLDPNDRDDANLRHGHVLDKLDSRFIGDLNPEGVFRAATSPHTVRDTSLNGSIGVWLAEKLSNEQSVAQSSTIRQEQGPGFLYGFSALVQKILLPALEEECLKMLPPPQSLQFLTNIYFEKMHPILPIVDEKRFHNLQPADPSYILIQQGMCLAASLNFIAGDFLILPNSESPLSHREFGRRLFSAMRTSVEMNMVTNKVVLIQALALMSLFSDGPDGGDTSSQLCGRVVQYVHLLGLHIQRRPNNNDDRSAVTLLCCIWALDRMNAAFHGRPVLMHERDIGRDMERCFEQQDPCFRLLLKVTELLDKVIELYRPSSVDSDSDTEFLSFESVLTKSAAMNIQTSHLATIETLYHAIAILSCRPKSKETARQGSSSYLRQSLAASKLTSTTAQEYCEQLILFPFVPYAVSLSLSVAYRELRHSKAQLYRSRARASLQANCAVLQNLGKVFWSASMMADMCESTLREMDRVYAAVSGLHQRKTQHSGVEAVRHPAVSANGNEQIETSSSSAPERSGPPVPSVNDPDDAGQLSHQEIDPFMFDSMSDIDVFDFFDPGFDLEGIDACLQGNLDLSFPTTLQQLS